jgi:hypothetical protein
MIETPADYRSFAFYEAKSGLFASSSSRSFAFYEAKSGLFASSIK